MTIMETQINSALFNPVALDGQQLANRIVMAPMTRARAIGSVPNQLMVTYYAQRASAGLIIAEGAAPSPHGLGYARIPGIFNEEQVQGWANITAAVHEKGGRIVLQLMHTGRIGHLENLPAGAEVLAPSSIRAEGDMWTDRLGMQPLPVPRAMSPAEIGDTIREFVRAAENAVRAGFDGIEVHAANGYLPEQFLNPHSNKRTDLYGGSIPNRARFLLELISAAAGAIGKEKVGVRISPYGNFNSMPAYQETFNTYDHLVQELDRQGIAYLHLIELAAKQHEEGRRLIEKIRKGFGKTLILNGGYTAESAAEALEAGRADLVAFGAPFISNPDLPERMKNGIPLSQADPSTFYSADEKGYTDYPFYS